MHSLHTTTHRLRGIAKMLVMATVAVPSTVLPMLAAAQTALNTAAAQVPAESSPAALSVTKRANSGGFVITVTNRSEAVVTGIVVTDRIGNGLPCPVDNPVIFAGDAAPTSGALLADLINPGVVLGALAGGKTAILTYSCQAN